MPSGKDGFALVVAGAPPEEANRRLVRIAADGTPQDLDVVFDEAVQGKLQSILWGDSLLDPIELNYLDRNSGEPRDAVIRVIDTHYGRPSVFETVFFAGAGDHRGPAVVTRYGIKGLQKQIHSVSNEADGVTFVYHYHVRTVTVVASKPGNGAWVDIETYSTDRTQPWGLGEKITDSDQDGIIDANDIVVSKPSLLDVSEGDDVGATVATDDDTLLLGAAGNDAGMVHVMRRDENSAQWEHEATLLPRHATNSQGVAIFGEMAVITERTDGELGGRMHRFEYWSRSQRWTKPRYDAKTTISTHYPIDQTAAMPVATDGVQIFVGVPSEDPNYMGVVATYKPVRIRNPHYRKPPFPRNQYNPNINQLSRYITILDRTDYEPDENDHAMFGTSVDLDNGILVIGARGGSAYAFAGPEGQKLTPRDESSGFGADVSIDANQIYVADSYGSVTIFRPVPAPSDPRKKPWTQVDRVIVGAPPTMGKLPSPYRGHPIK